MSLCVDMTMNAHRICGWTESHPRQQRQEVHGGQNAQSNVDLGPRMRPYNGAQDINNYVDDYNQAVEQGGRIQPSEYGRQQAI